GGRGRRADAVTRLLRRMFGKYAGRTTGWFLCRPPPPEADQPSGGTVIANVSPMRVLITGITGFAGSHLAEYILANHPDVAVFGTYRWRSRMENLETLAANGVLDVIEGRYSAGAGQADEARKGRVNLLHCELTDAGAAEKLISAVRPDRIFHLAAQSFVQSSFDEHHRPPDRVDRGGKARAGDLPRRPHE